MRISIRLVARLLRLPILRIDGDIRILDDRVSWVPSRWEPRRSFASAPRAVSPPPADVGRLLAHAEADLEELSRVRNGGPRRNGAGPPPSG